ncbi:hypothetical protein F5B20DRAFT_552825 [Whalleya microplaca]|nr:hypothetical protein F5B20DRAFT_552825 [Whalleya microplaca]
MRLRWDVMACARIILLFILTHSHAAASFLWRGGSQVRSENQRLINQESIRNPSHLLQTSSSLTSSYELALNELQQLESEPLCHRIAARLLVNNCQLLEGKDEATVLTDSGRKIRDFVDSYAASLAICDLERGSFLIPPACSKFREPVLGQLPLQNTVHLHVTSEEIDNCLAGLGASDSAWNTWVSYRHKALRFCEAARADNDRAQHILLFQRLTKIMSNLADDVDERFDKRMADLDQRAQKTNDKLDSLSPHIDHLRDGLQSAEDLVSSQLAHALKRSSDTINTGIENAANLQKLLEVIFKSVSENHAEAASAHEQSLQVMSRQTELEIGTAMTAITAAFASTAALQNQIELARFQAAELETRQNNLERGMNRLIGISENLSNQHDDHANLLRQAQNMTNDILDSLEDTAVIATRVNNSVRKESSATTWWPYIWCPLASLTMGSYGLPPSAMRNLGLVALGEVAGFMVSSIHSLSFTTNLPLLSTFRLFTNFQSWGTFSAPATVLTNLNSTT